MKLSRLFEPYHEARDVREARQAVVALHLDGWSVKSVYRVIGRWIEKVEAVRRVIRTAREELGVPELCFSHGDQEYPPKLSQPILGRCLHAESK